MKTNKLDQIISDESRLKALDYLVFQMKSILIAANVSAFIIAFILYGLVPHHYVLIWFVCLWSISGFRWFQAQHYQKLSKPDVHQEYPKFAFSAFVASFVWGCGIVSFMTHLEPMQHAYLSFILVAMASAACVKMPKDIFSIFLFGIGVPSALWMLFFGGDDVFTLGILFSLGIFMLWVATLQFDRELYMAITSGIDNNALIQDMAKLSQALKQSDDGILVMNHVGVVEYVNPSFLRISRYDDEDIVGNQASFFEKNKRNEPHLKQLWESVTQGKPWASRMMMPRKNDSDCPCLITLSPIYDGKNVLTHFICIQKDLRDYEILEAQLQQANKMQALGTLTGGIAHDFNNILAGISCHTFLIKSAHSQHEKTLQRIAKIDTLTQNAADMISHLLAFSRNEKVSLEAFELHSFLGESLDIHLPTLPQHIRIHQHLGLHEINAHIDTAQLRQVINNLLNNAADALANTPEPTISIRLQQQVSLPKHLINDHTSVISYAQISIQDNGSGIEKEVLEHIFEPFFTTKEIGKGTGLGLAMAYGTIQSHHGQLTIDSEVGVGSTFHIYLPT